MSMKPALSRRTITFDVVRDCVTDAAGVLLDDSDRLEDCDRTAGSTYVADGDVDVDAVGDTVGDVEYVGEYVAVTVTVGDSESVTLGVGENVGVTDGVAEGGRGVSGGSVASTAIAI